MRAKHPFNIPRGASGFEHYMHRNNSEINFEMIQVGNQTRTSSKGEHL